MRPRVGKRTISVQVITIKMPKRGKGPLPKGDKHGAQRENENENDGSDNLTWMGRPISGDKVESTACPPQISEPASVPGTDEASPTALLHRSVSIEDSTPVGRCMRFLCIWNSPMRWTKIGSGEFRYGFAWLNRDTFLDLSEPPLTSSPCTRLGQQRAAESVLEPTCPTWSTLLRGAVSLSKIQCQCSLQGACMLS